MIKSLKEFLLSQYTTETQSKYDSSDSGDRWVSGTLLKSILGVYSKASDVTAEIATAIAGLAFVPTSDVSPTLASSTADTKLPTAKGIRDYITGLVYTKAESDTKYTGEREYKHFFASGDATIDVSQVRVAHFTSLSTMTITLIGHNTNGANKTVEELTIILSGDNLAGGASSITIVDSSINSVGEVVTVTDGTTRILNGSISGVHYHFTDTLGRHTYV